MKRFCYESIDSGMVRCYDNQIESERFRNYPDIGLPGFQLIWNSSKPKIGPALTLERNLRRRTTDEQQTTCYPGTTYLEILWRRARPPGRAFRDLCGRDTRHPGGERGGQVHPYQGSHWS